MSAVENSKSRILLMTGLAIAGCMLSHLKQGSDASDMFCLVALHFRGVDAHIFAVGSLLQPVDVLATDRAP
jgi:hypothetical protein